MSNKPLRPGHVEILKVLRAGTEPKNIPTLTRLDFANLDAAINMVEQIFQAIANAATEPKTEPEQVPPPPAPLPFKSKHQKASK